MSELTLTGEELVRLFETVFGRRDDDRGLALIVDLPDDRLPDNDRWRERRQMALEWHGELRRIYAGGPLEPKLFFYRNAGSNNADLPPTARRYGGSAPPADADAALALDELPFPSLFDEHAWIVAPTELSTSAPLKLAAPDHGYRAATMPGFAPSMIPALALDYVEVDRRVRVLKRLLDQARAAELCFETEGRGTQELSLDLRHRTAHASGGLIREPGVVGNLPSGESYIVPYEGERAGDASRSAGELPVQFADGTVVYRIEGNRAVGVEGDAPAARRESELLEREPAYANLAELGLGVLADFGIRPVGEVLLDEKLGLHIAFGRSDHFGGAVGAADFSSPDAVVHDDRVFLRETQPGIRVRSLDLVGDDAARVPLIRDGGYVIDF